MLQCFYPDSYQDSAYSIDYEKLRMQGYEAIIYDIDNTLVCHGAPADERSMALIERLKGLGFSIMLLSNNKEPRVKQATAKSSMQIINVPYCRPAHPRSVL